MGKKAPEDSLLRTRTHTVCAHSSLQPPDAVQVAQESREAASPNPPAPPRAQSQR